MNSACCSVPSPAFLLGAQYRTCAHKSSLELQAAAKGRASSESLGKSPHGNETPFLYVLSFPTHPVARLRKWPGCPSLPPKPAALSISQPPFFFFRFSCDSSHGVEQHAACSSSSHIYVLMEQHAWTTKFRLNNKLIA